MPEVLARKHDQKAKAFARKLNKYTIRLDKIINEIAITDEVSNVFWLRKQRELKAVYEDLRKTEYEWFKYEMPIAYNEKAQLEIRKIKGRQVVPREYKDRISYRNFINKDLSKQSVKALIENAATTLEIGLLQGEKAFVSLMRLTQQINLSEKQIAKALATGFRKTGTVQGARKSLQKQLLKKAVDGKYIKIINKNGQDMFFNIKSYSELVARTKMRDVSTISVLNVAAEVQSDLVEVSAHNTTTAICMPYEGKVFSLSGSNRDFPILDATTPFHPNCLHSISVAIVEAMIADGTYRKYSEFSLGGVQEHPTRKSFVPVADRTDKWIASIKIK